MIGVTYVSLYMVRYLHVSKAGRQMHSEASPFALIIEKQMLKYGDESFESDSDQYH